MALFSTNFNAHGNGMRQTGSARFWELLGRDIGRFFLVNLLTLAGFLPFALGVLAAILSASVLVLLPACLIGGAVAGPALSGMYDTIYRSLRDAPGKWFDNYRRALRQNWRQSILPGMILCLMLGLYCFMLMLFWWSSRFPGIGTIAVFAAGLVLITMFFSIYWPQIVLFDQTPKQRFLNSLLFLIRYFWKMLGCAAVQLLYWALIILFLPWTAFLLPLTGLWAVLFAANFLIYDTVNRVFHVEEQIAEAFPAQAPFYEDDETWLARKHGEMPGQE
jgi:uncharacterized membrane protein YesL